jgi:N-acetylglucosaminyldiphosphoundecaprenol N-acetyl-beta-D-mannosaminyltransferase
MYRRYGEPTWDSADATGVAAAAAAAPASASERRARPSRRATSAGRPVSTSRLPSVRLHGVEFHAITEQRCVEHILDELDAGHGGVVVTPNLDHLRRCTRDLTFSALVAEANLVVADGMPLIWASRLQRTPLPQRVAGSDLISSLSAAAAKRNKSIFLLGGAPGTAEGAAKILRDRSPELRVAGTYCPTRGFENDEAAMNAMIAALVAAKPDIVYVGLGSPKQEFLIERIRKVLPNAWWLGVGVSFSFLCGDVKRAPVVLRKLGLEWAHRLVQEPRRLFHRYIVVGLPFGASLLGKATLRGMTSLVGRVPSSNGQYHAAPSNNGNGSAVAAAIEAARPVIAPDYSAHARDATTNAPTGEQTESARPTTAPAPAHGRSLHKLRAMILLGGSVRPTPLTTSINRSVLDLPLDGDGSILNHWLAHARELARHAGLEQLPVRVMVNQTSPEPSSAAPRYEGTFRVERDLSEYRGTGGVLRDLAADYADDDLILVANAAQILMDPLAAIAMALDRKAGDFSLVSHNDGTPSGVMLVSCKTLRLIPTTGYVDMKEQALPAIAARYQVTVMHRRGRPTGLAVRSLADYVNALRHYHRRRQGKPALNDPLAEDWLPAFALVEEGATVDPRAHVHDSVVLKGGVVESGAVVVRSIVCAGGVVRKDRTAVDQFVCAGS